MGKCCSDAHTYILPKIFLSLLIFYTGVRKVEVVNASTVAGVAVGCAIVTGGVVALVAAIISAYWRKKVNTL